MPSRLFLCATTRLAQTLRAQGPANQAVWATPEAMTIGTWLGRLLEEAVLGGTTVPLLGLDGSSEKLLWEKLIGEALDEAAAPLFDTAGMAASAAEAHALCETWGIRPAGDSLADETRLFLAWQQEFRRRCQARGWQSAAQQHQAAIDLIAQGEGELPEAICFAGFDRFTPQEERLRAALAERGVSLSDLPLPRTESAAARTVAVPDRDTECRAVAAWAKARLAADPKTRLGIVAPDLGGVRQALEFALDDALHPEALRPGAGHLPRCYNFSLGRPLAAEPVVRTALDLIALGTAHRLEQGQLSALLRNRLWSAGTAEADERARVDVALRRELEFFTSLPALLRLTKRCFARDEGRCSRLIRHLEDFIAAIAEAGGRKRLPSAWRPLFADWLKILHWPGDRPLSSEEFQAREAFVELLGAFARLDDILGPIGPGEATARLARSAGEQVFQPKTRGTPALQVLGVLESAGLEFDALWVMGLTDNQWPPQPRPNPLLPAELQRRAGSPHASAEVELGFASAVHRRLLHSAPEVTFSYAQGEGNKLLRPSPLIAGVPLAEAPPPGATTPPPDSSLEHLADAWAPPVAEGEKVSGGTGLLKAQAICPAWAYYQYRLGAKALDTAVEGLDPMARGTLVHGALEHFWQATGDWQTLVAQDETARHQAIAAAVAAALTDFETDSHRELPARYRALEGERLHRLLAVWLALEADRAPFAVAACEQESELEIEGIRVKTIIDRIDHLEDGRALILDYKTGSSIDTQNWASDRLTEPQLPIYAALALGGEGDHPVAGAAFAKVLIDKPAFAGVAAEQALLPGVTGLDNDKRKSFPAERFPDWPAVLDHWRARLLAVAGEVKAGDAAVRFADEAALRYCEVLPLLRLAERRQQLAEAANITAGPESI